MLFIVGGAARAGKSIIARKFLLETKIPYFSLDVLMTGLANASPRFGVNPEASNIARAEKLWPVARAVAINIIETDLDYLLEGDSILPEQVIELAREYNGRVKACFIGYVDIDPALKLKEMREFSGHPNDWVSGHSDEYVLSLINEMIEFSKYLRQECKQSNIPYFDVSYNFSNTIDSVVSYLRS